MKILNASTDVTLGGENASNEVVSSQKATKVYIDNKFDNSGVDSALQPEDVVSTYNSLGTEPVNGTAIAGALSTLDIPIVDQTYSASSTNAQSGVAVSSALDSLIDLIPDVDQTYSASSTNAQSGTAVATALLNVLPSQEGQSGKFLSTDGTIAVWETVSGSLPSQTGNEGKFLSTDGTIAVWETVSGSLPSQTGHTSNLLTTDGTDAYWVETQEIYSVIESYYNNGSWYRLYAPDNTGYSWCEMGGFYYKGSTMAGTDNTITFLKSFKDLSYNFIAFPMHSTAALNQYSLYEKYVSRTESSTILRVTSAIFGYEWQACGYIEA